MKVIILGSGPIGYSIARYLALEDNDVVVIDQNAEALKQMGEKLDIRPIVGQPSHPHTLKTAHAHEADLLIAVTDSDEVNIVACYLCSTHFKIPTKIARIRNPTYLLPSSLFPFIDVAILPEQEVSKALMRSTEIQGAFDTLLLVNSSIKIVGLRCPATAPLLHTSLRLLGTFLQKNNLVVLWCRRHGRSFIPKKDDTLEPHDEIYILTKTEDIPFIMAGFNLQSEEDRRILIVGGGQIGFSFAQEASSWSGRSFLLEKDQERSENAAQLLDNVEVLRGDALETLSEMDLSAIETVVCVTDDDKVNILSALLSKRQGAKRSLALLNQSKYADFVTSLGIDGIISPQSVTVSTILRHVRRGSICSLNVLGDMEVIEAQAKETSQVIGLSVEEMNIPGSIFIAALLRGDSFISLPEKVIVSKGDTLIIVVKKELVARIERLFSPHKTYK